MGIPRIIGQSRRKARHYKIHAQRAHPANLSTRFCAFVDAVRIVSARRSGAEVTRRCDAGVVAHGVGQMLLAREPARHGHFCDATHTGAAGCTALKSMNFCPARKFFLT